MNYNRQQRTDIPAPVQFHHLAIAEITQQTDKRILLQVKMNNGRTRPVWLPKSQIELHANGRSLILTIKPWLYKDRQLQQAQPATAADHNPLIYYGREKGIEQWIKNN